MKVFYITNDKKSVIFKRINKFSKTIGFYGFVGGIWYDELDLNLSSDVIIQIELQVLQTRIAKLFLREAKRRYPIGTIIKDIYTDNEYLVNNVWTFINNNVYAECIQIQSAVIDICKGNWAPIIIS